MDRWLDLTTKDELALYLHYWKKITLFERRIYVYRNYLGKSTGKIGKIFGATDIEDHYLDGCWNLSGEPVLYQQSNYIWSIEQYIDKRWYGLYEKSGLNLGEKKHQHWVIFAFDELLEEILLAQGKIKIVDPLSRDEWHKEYTNTQKQLALLRLNIPKLDLLVSEWLNK